MDYRFVKSAVDSVTLLDNFIYAVLVLDFRQYLVKCGVSVARVCD